MSRCAATWNCEFIFIQIIFFTWRLESDRLLALFLREWWASGPDCEQCVQILILAVHCMGEIHLECDLSQLTWTLKTFRLSMVQSRDRDVSHVYAFKMVRSTLLCPGTLKWPSGLVRSEHGFRAYLLTFLQNHRVSGLIS